MKLIAGKMNIPYIKCKSGYAEGARQPKYKQVKSDFVACIKLRKNERLVK